MKQALVKFSLAVAAALSLAVFAVLPAGAQSTAFTYQGMLNDGGPPANGLHDFRFRLFNAAAGGSQVGSTLCVDNVTVTAGVFTAQLDFGQQFATTAPRYVEIEVRRDTGLTCANLAGFVVMAPRQLLTATPMASHANSAFALDAADGSPTNAVFVDNNGKVGVGTTSPASLLHLEGNAPVMVLQDTASPSNQAGYVTFWNNASTETGWMGYGSTGSPQFSVVNARTNGDLRLYTGTGGDINLTPGSGGDINLVPASGGKVGVGTYTPTATLDVRGDIRLGPSGEFRAASGDENLRIIRGTVRSDGVVLKGSGFTSQRTAAGTYLISFTTPFSSPPCVTTAGHCITPTATYGPEVYVGYGGATTSDVVIRVYLDTASDRTFDFIAIGPR